jgi:hypothetical protein
MSVMAIFRQSFTVFTGDQGTVLQVEILDGQHGAAVDNKGNIFKVVW